MSAVLIASSFERYPREGAPMVAALMQYERGVRRRKEAYVAAPETRRDRGRACGARLLARMARVRNDDVARRSRSRSNRSRSRAAIAR
jgi:hypothetical protein